MKTIATSSIATESKNARLASCEEKPPSDSVVKLWISASIHVMPATR